MFLKKNEMRDTENKNTVKLKLLKNQKISQRTTIAYTWLADT